MEKIENGFWLILGLILLVVVVIGTKAEFDTFKLTNKFQKVIDEKQGILTEKDVEERNSYIKKNILNHNSKLTIYMDSLKSNFMPSKYMKKEKIIELKIIGNNCGFVSYLNCYSLRQTNNLLFGFKNLEKLVFEGNSFIELPSSLKGLPKLKSITLKNNPIRNTDEIHRIKNLEYLEINNCGIVDIPQNLHNLSKLKYLNLDRNRIDKTAIDSVEKRLIISDTEN